MKLDRDTNKNGKGKYALVKLRVSDCSGVTNMDEKPCFIFPEAAIDYGDTPDTEFFVIRLKDKYASAALAAYAVQAQADDPEFALAVFSLAIKAAGHPSKRRPD